MDTREINCFIMYQTKIILFEGLNNINNGKTKSKAVVKFSQLDEEKTNHLQDNFATDHFVDSWRDTSTGQHLNCFVKHERGTKNW